MGKVFVYQIYYDEETRAGLDPAFLPLNNTKSARPDWYEYWAIRSLMEKSSFEDDDYLGIFSPRFKQKTGFTGAEVHDLVVQSGTEVIGFSPEFDQVAVFQNAFFQGDFWQRGLLDVSRDLFEAIDLGVDVKNTWADQTRTIFSNYFVAKFAFWKEWFFFAERIFSLCEESKGSLAEKMTSFTRYRGVTDHYQMKVFVMERLVNAILERRSVAATSQFNFLHQRAVYNQRMTRNGRPPADYGQFLLLDALKGQYIKTQQPVYLNLFRHHLSSKS